MSSTGASHNTPIAGEPKAPTTAETNNFSALEEKDPEPSNDLPGILEISGASVHPQQYQNGETPALPNPGEEEKNVTPGYADITDSIVKAVSLYIWSLDHIVYQV